MREVAIPANIIPESASYQRTVILYGHEPGVLSGADLTGKARNYAGRYFASRKSVAELVKPFGVMPMLSRCTKRARLVRVWCDAETLEPVRLVFAPGASQ